MAQRHFERERTVCLRQLLYSYRSSQDCPRNTENGKRTAYFTAENPWKGYNVPEYSCGTIKAADGETDLYWRMVKPVNFDPNRSILPLYMYMVVLMPTT